MTTKRELSSVSADLHIALRREVADIAAIGRLLIEAKGLLKHGKWYPWLHREFRLSPETASRYMRASDFLDRVKSVTVTDLRLAPGALYFLSGQGPDSEPVRAVLKAATERWVDEAAARSLFRNAPSGNESEEDSFGSGASCPLSPKDERPPPPAVGGLSAARQGRQESFKQAVQTLLGLITKPPREFVDQHSPDRLEQVADFMRAVAQAAARSDKAA
jgi:hypothetical protein